MTAQNVMSVSDPMTHRVRFGRDFPNVDVKVVGTRDDVLIRVAAEAAALQRAGIVITGMVKLTPSGRLFILKIK